MSKEAEDLSLGDFFTLHEPHLFQLLDLIPIPIHAYRGNGISAFVNSAFKETFNIKDTSQVVGHFNLIADPFHNDVLNLRQYIERLFHGQPIFAEDIKVPMEYVTQIFQVDRKDVTNEMMYQSIRGFPVKNADEEVIYVVLLFELKSQFAFGKSINTAKEGELTF